MTRSTIIAATLALSAPWLAPGLAPAQRMSREDQPDLTIDAKVRREVIEGVIKHLNEAYVFPETARKMEEDLRRRLEGKEYDKVTGAKQFARDLTDHLRSVSRDKHLGVDYDAEGVPAEPGPPGEKPGPEERRRMEELGGRINFGFDKVERMEGNVGYLNLRGFFPAELGGETAAAAMTLLSHADALIIDLRQNGGGDPGMVALISSYLFDAEPVHLNDLYFRPDDSTHQWWTFPHVPGRRYGGSKPVYVLTARRTFSAAEEFAYNLKNLKRAKLIGETTGGGAHPGGMRRISEHFAMFVPSGRAINPISKTNWEGKGVAPDVDVPEELALTTAHLDALKTLAAKDDGKGPDGKPDPMRARQFKRAIERLEKQLDELKTKSKEGEPKKAD